MSEVRQGLELPKVIVIGRTFDEYVRMLDLTMEDVTRLKILDVPAGACSFAAEANAMGGSVTAADIAYYHSSDDLLKKGKDDIGLAITGISKVMEHYKWDYFRDLEALERHRLQVLEKFADHRKASLESYVPCVLPELPFADGEFDMTVSAHFLFTYADRLDHDFHLNTIRELLRVTKKEVRIFPLVDQTGHKYGKMESLKEFIQGLGWSTEERDVPYEFQRNANSMLRIFQP
jgi:hypothetical protein